MLNGVFFLQVGQEVRCPSCSSSPIAPFAVIATFFVGPGEGDGNTEFTPFVSASFFLAFGAEVGSEAEEERRL